MNVLKELKIEVRKQVAASLQAKQNIQVAGIEIAVIDCGGGQVYLDGFGRQDAMSYDLVRGLTAEVVGRIKSQYREAGPEAALAAVKGTEEA